MAGAIISWILSSVPLIIAFVIICIIAIYYVVRWKSAMDDTKNKIDQAPLPQCRAIIPDKAFIDNKFNQVSQRIDSVFASMVQSATKNSQFIEAKIDNLQVSSDRPMQLVQSNSPLSPSELGRKIIEELGLNDIIARNADKAVRYIEGNVESKNPYDIQKYCIDTASIELEKLLDEQDVDKVKRYAYNNGKSLFYYGSLIGVLVRDLYFSRKGIDVNEVDKYDPTKQSNPAE
ncbi:MAG: hypothetical protein J1E33_03785 [Alistipes sp.]|nr:hypothetical protein [Alistipes sp.]